MIWRAGCVCSPKWEVAPIEVQRIIDYNRPAVM